MPDFDIDFCYVNRQRVIDYVIEKYGSDHVSQIVTFGTMAARAAIRDVGRALDIPYNVCDRVAKLIPQALNMTIERALKGSKELRDLYENDAQINGLINTALRLEGMPRHASTHAAGVVISDKPIAEYVPLAVNDEAVVTQYTMTALEELGLLKMDFLGLRNLTVIADTQRYIKKNNPEFDIEKIPLDDKATYEMMGKGLTDGVFQFESDGMKNVLRGFHPESIEDLTAILSLYRPGPMDSIPKYIHNRHHPEDVTYPTPLLKPILSVTYGCIVYQEQVMQIFRTLAGYTLGRADIVRRAMAKKKHDVMERERQFFIHGERDKNGNVICDFVPVDYDVRINYKIVDLKNKTYTDINYPCGVPSDESIAVFKTKLKTLAQQNEYVALSGNISPVLSSLYSELCSIITAQGAKVTIDCSKHALFLAAKQKPYAIKPNLNELNEAFNLNCTSKDDIKNAAMRLCESGIKNVLVSLDKDGAIAVCNKKAYFVSVCDVPVLNTVGAGDAFLSGFIYSKMSGFDDSLCLKYAASFAQANVSHRACDKKSFDDFKKYVSQIRVEEF